MNSPAPLAGAGRRARSIPLGASGILTLLLAAGCGSGVGSETGSEVYSDVVAATGTVPEFASRMSGNKTMLFVGDSITAGVCDGFRHTYREPLLERLAADGLDIDAVGDRTSADYPGDCFTFPDGEHVSYPGAMTQNLAVELAATIDSFKAPDIAIVLSGVNDLNRLESPQHIVSGLQDIVGTIETRNPEARIYVATLTDNAGYGPGVPALNAEIAVMFETEPNVDIIDLNPAFVLGTHDSDGLHPNELGARVIAETIHAALVSSGAFAAGTASGELP